MEEIHIIISDQRMPEMTGVAFFASIQEQYPHIIRIILTAYSDIQAIVDAINQGQVYRFLTKPWVKEELMVSIENARETYLLKQSNRDLLTELQDQNRNLEKIVEARTQELSTKSEQLSHKNKLLTESITYAQRIQTALLPKIQQLKSILPDVFVLQIPKDIVSGDFFWLSKVDHPEEGELIVLAVGDCTGHGVPGAFVSIIAYHLLSEIVNKNGIYAPAEILRHLDQEVFRNLNSEGTELVCLDGMDIALCTIYPAKKMLDFAGAKNPLYWVNQEGMHIVKGSRDSIGGDRQSKINNSFSQQRLFYPEPIEIYMFSDGYVDQFGGPNNRKFSYKQLRELILFQHDRPMDHQRQLFREKLLSWQSEQEQVDDIILLGLRLL